jgi:hypothetical protein
MTGRLEDIGLSSIAEINVLPARVRDEIYLRLIPDRLLAFIAMDRQMLMGNAGHVPVRITAPDGSAWARMELWANPDDRDPALLLDIGMSGFAVPELSLVQINNPSAPRFAIDRDEDGRDTLLGTVCRNEAEEGRALAAGLAPGQVRSGLRMLGAVLESMDEFCQLLGSEFYLLEPLFYHSAILYERQHCGYFIGRERMEQIHAGFQPGGELHRRLDGSSPFRGPGLERTARGRSWAIHDGILGDPPWQGVKMFRAPQALSRISTFPGGAY